MKFSKRKIVVLFILADALLITLPFVAIEILTYYHQSRGMPVPKHWWFVPYSMGAGLLILLGLMMFDLWQRMGVWLKRDKNAKQ